MKRQSFFLISLLAILSYVDAIGIESELSKKSRRRKDKRKKKDKDDDDDVTPTPTPTPTPDPEPAEVDFPTNYFNRSTYQSKSRTDKLNDLWTALKQESGPIDNYWSEWGTLFSTDFALSMRSGDEMRDGRLKLAHTQGIIAKVRWTPIAGTDYSGVQQTGYDDVIMRLSETGMIHEDSKGLKPSVAFKFLRDGEQSDNIVAMPSFGNSGHWNFLKSAFQTRVEPWNQDTNTCEVPTLQGKLLEGQQWPFSCGIHPIFQNLADGTFLPSASVNIPYQLAFETNEPYRSMFSESRTSTEWYDQLINGISSGADLFTVRALTAPAGDPDSEWIDIATITLTSDLFTSKFGDERLFFQHVKLNGDRDFWPDSWRRLDREIDPKIAQTRDNLWGDFVPAGVWPVDQEEAKAMFMEQEASGCPFQWLLDALS